MLNPLRNRSGELTVATLIAINAMVLLYVGFFSISVYFLSKVEAINSAEKSQLLSDIQQRRIEALTKDIDSLRKDLGVEKKAASQTTAELTKKLSEAQALTVAAETQRQKELAQTTLKLSDLEKGVIAAKTYNTAQIITEWRPKIAYVECDWKNSNGVVYQTQSGSGILTWETSNHPAVVTNKHIVIDQAGTPTAQCRVQFPDRDKIFAVSAAQISKSSAGYDWARIDLENTDASLNSLAEKAFNTCSETPALGTNIVILGYPGIGSQTDITATEGIISGYDNNYFITSAKVEHGNSGGAAILLQKNCYLGIPTFTKTGGLESLARILNTQFIFPTQ